MAIPERVKTKMKEEGLKGVNKPKRTPSHPTKSHCVMAKEGDTYKLYKVQERIRPQRRIRHVRRVTMQGIMLKVNQLQSYQRSTGHIK